MGQALLPEHFQAQESSLREDLALRLRLQPMPFRGVGSLKWNVFQLAHGVLRLEQLTLLLPEGTLVDLPGNTVAPEDFNLNKVNALRARVHLHLLQGAEHEDLVSDPTITTSKGDTVEREVQRIALSTEAYREKAWSFPLAEFEKSPDGPWSLVTDFLPELIRVSDSPFFEPLLARISSLTDRLRNALLEEIQVNYLANKSQLAARECLKGYHRFRSLLDNVGRDYHPHPFELFRHLHELYIEVCMMREVNPEEVAVYKHGRIGECFKTLLEALETQVIHARTAITYHAFSRKEGLQVCELPKVARKARNVYLLLQKPGVATPLDLTSLKLASESRLPTVQRDALTGVTFERIPAPPFHHPFTAEVEFFELRPGEEWDHVLREGRLAFYQHEALKQLRAFVYWRDE